MYTFCDATEIRTDKKAVGKWTRRENGINNREKEKGIGDRIAGRKKSYRRSAQFTR